MGRMKDESILDGPATGRVVIVRDGLSDIFDMIVEYNPALLFPFMRCVEEVEAVDFASLCE